MGKKLIWNMDDEEELVGWLKFTKDSPEKGCLMCVVVGDEPAGKEDLGYMIDPLDLVIRVRSRNDYEVNSTRGFLGLNTDLVVFQRTESDRILKARNATRRQESDQEGEAVQYVFQPCTLDDLKWYEAQKTDSRENWEGIPALRMDFIENVKKVVKARSSEVSEGETYDCPAPATTAVMLAMDRCPWVAVAGVNEWFHVDPALEKYRKMGSPKKSTQEARITVTQQQTIGENLTGRIIDFEFLTGLHQDGNLFWNMTGFARE